MERKSRSRPRSAKATTPGYHSSGSGTSFPEKIAFVVGAPRCGTTTLSRLFRQHPQVCFSRVKEPHFFSRHPLGDLDDAALRDAVRHNYLGRFFGACADGAMLMEGSPTYLYTPEQMAPILRLWPNARFIIALRDPLAMVPSLHSRLLVTGDETIRDFKKAWEMTPERRRGRRIPRSCIEPRWLLYDQAAAFATHVSRFFDAVGRDRCHVVLTDDLSTDPSAAYAAVCDFLGLEPWPGTEFKAERTNSTYRIGWLQRLLNRPPKSVQTLLAGEYFLIREGKVRADSENRLLASFLALRKRLLRWNQLEAPRRPLDVGMRREIIDRYRDEVDRLAQLIDRDLSHWLRADA